MNETYMCRIKTPIGEMKGRLLLNSNGNHLSGKIESMGINTSFNNGVINGNTCKFSGTINSFIGNINYDANGIIEGDNIKIIADTNQGTFEINGKRQ